METDTLWKAGSLDLDRCPHCRIAKPLLAAMHGFNTADSADLSRRQWRVYVCSSCGGAVLGAAALDVSPYIVEVYPSPETIEQGLPAKAEAFLLQAIECLHAPSGAIMLCASSVDAMLKEKGLKQGSLSERIDKAAAQGLITQEMAMWAHDVRLDANDERHADENASLPTEQDAKRCIEFTKALGMFLFMLPLMVERGRKRTSKQAKAAELPTANPPAPTHTLPPR